MSINNMAEFEEKPIYIKRESGESNYDKQPDGDSNHGKTKWIVLLVVCFITFFYGIFSFVNDLPFKAISTNFLSGVASFVSIFLGFIWKSDTWNTQYL